jgi:hypothetical protein
MLRQGRALAASPEAGYILVVGRRRSILQTLRACRKARNESRIVVKLGVLMTVLFGLAATVLAVVG